MDNGFILVLDVTNVKVGDCYMKPKQVFTFQLENYDRPGQNYFKGDNQCVTSLITFETKGWVIIGQKNGDIHLLDLANIYKEYKNGVELEQSEDIKCF